MWAAGVSVLCLLPTRAPQMPRGTLAHGLLLIRILQAWLIAVLQTLHTGRLRCCMLLGVHPAQPPQCHPAGACAGGASPSAQMLSVS
jgi:hypothetical protein